MSAGIVSSFLVWAALLSFIFRLKKRPVRLRMLIAAVITVSAIVPLSGLPIPLYIRAGFGDLSIVTQLLLGIYIINSLTGIYSTPARKTAYLQLCAFVLLTAAWFYPTSLGLTYFDPYRVGYITDQMHWVALGYFGLAALTLLLLGSSWTSGILCLATLSFTFGYLESSNYWDYMMDPVLTIGAFIFLAKNFAGRFKETPKKTHPRQSF